jgi:hypothetical protein
MDSSREAAIKHLLRPIKWDWSSSIRARQNLVSARHIEVTSDRPLLTAEERARADAWAKAEAHAGLWD